MKNKKKIVIFIIIFAIITIIAISVDVHKNKKENISSEKIVANTNTYNAENTTNESTEKEYIYLSDIPYIEDKSYAASGHTIHLDENDSKALLTLNVNNASKPFIKGICAWATSEIVYNLTNYNYDYFTSYLGVDIGEQSNYFNTGTKFYIYTSVDGENWELKFESNTLYGWSEAQFAKVDIKNAKYLKLVADDNSNSWWSSWYDEATYANAKLIKENYEEKSTTIDVIKTLDQYDEIIKSHYGEEITGEYELTLLQREFVKNVGYDVLQALAEYSSEYKETILWLMNDTETLRLYLAGGKPEGSYTNSIKVLTKLYTKYKDDLANTTITKYGNNLGEVYRKMMLSISLTHSGKVYLWIDGVERSDPITRYEIYKKLYLHEGNENELIENKIFESLTVEEMRWVMNTIIDDEEILWLNNYVRNAKNGATSPYSYIKYTFGYDYSLDKYYSQENYTQWDEKYNLSKYNITYKKGEPKLWIVFEEGSVCGGLSKTGSCIWGSYKGLPNTCISQPGHCAYIYYTQNENGDGIWNLGNDVSGWGQSGKTEHLNVRTMNDWGSGSYTTGWNASYILLAQAAQNDYQNYEKSEEILMQENIYSNDNEKLEEIYRNALNTQNINFDAWLGLVNLYLNNEEKTEEDYYNLAEEIATTLKFYPRPMYDLLTLLSPKFETTAYSVKYTMLRTTVLTEAKNATSNNTLQVQAVQQVANALLGFFDSNIATFSFDGENAGKIVLSSQYDDSDVQWDYSLDGGNTWTQTGEHKKELTPEELSLITEQNDIKVHIIGVDYSEDNIFTIDIKESAGLPENLYANDLENRLIGATSNIEWKYNENDEWTSYSTATPDLTGNKTIIVRAGATGVYLQSNNETTYNFTEDNQPDTRKYIPISHLSIADVSSEEPGHSGSATMAIDGNINTRWHNNWNGNDTEKYITIKLDTPVYLSAVEYVPLQSTIPRNGMFKDVVLYVSMDGENWTQVATAAGWAANGDPKEIELTTPVQAQYVKLQSIVSYSYNGGTSNFATATMINLFEDSTKRTNPIVGIQYNITDLTNKDVTATLVDPSTEITITNNNGKDTYVFTENGEFTFEFEDKAGNKGTETAKVTWIDKTPPTAEISYSTKEETTKEVAVTISNFSEEVTITNNSGSNTYTFTKNGEFTFEFEDKAGNKGTITAKVDWISSNSENTNDLYLKSTKYKTTEDNKYLYKISPNTTLADFISNCETNKEANIKVYKDVNKDGKIDTSIDTEVSKTDILETGMILVDSLNNKEIVLTICVLGDIDCNGKVTITDFVAVNQYLLKEISLSEMQFFAADISNDKKVTITDFVAINQYLLKEIEF